MSFVKRSLDKYKLNDQNLEIDKVIEIIIIIDMITYCENNINNCIRSTNDKILINKFINLIYSKYIFREEILRMISRLVKILIIQICENGDRRLTDEKLILISKYFPEMETLNISWNNNITDNGLINFKNLKCLNAGLCQNISDDGLVNMKHLKNLHIQSNNKITGIYFKKMKHLEELDISCCRKINQSYIYGIEFKKLSICWNCRVNDNCIKNIKVDYLDVSGNEKITDVSIKSNIKNFKQVIASFNNNIASCTKVVKYE
jgi:hypothetical protein